MRDPDKVRYRGRDGKTNIPIDNDRRSFHDNVRNPYSQNNIDRINNNVREALDHQFTNQARGEMADPNKFSSRYNYDTYEYDYYSGSQAKVFFGDIWVDDIVTVQYNIRQTKEPIYGYASQHYDAVAAGTVLGQGTLIIAFKEVGYLNVIRAYMEEQAAGVKLAIANVKNRSGAGDSDIYRASDYSARITGNFNPGLIRQSETIEDVLDTLKNADLDVETTNTSITAQYAVEGSTADKDIIAAQRSVGAAGQRQDVNNNVDFNSSRGNGIKDFEDAAEVLEDAIWGDSNGEPKGINQRTDGLLRADEFDYIRTNMGEMEGIKSARGNNYEDVMNILITFGDMTDKRAEHTLYLLNDVHFTGQSVQISPTGEPIAEVYEFFFRDVNKTINTGVFNINAIKFNVGTDEAFKIAQLEEIEAALNNKSTSLVISVKSYYDGSAWVLLPVTINPEQAPLEFPVFRPNEQIGTPQSLNDYVAAAISEYFIQSADINKNLPYEKLALNITFNGSNDERLGNVSADSGPIDVTGAELTTTGFNMIAERQGTIGFNFVIVAPGSNPSSILDIVKREDFFTSTPVPTVDLDPEKQVLPPETGEIDGGLGEVTRTEPEGAQIIRDGTEQGLDEFGVPIPSAGETFGADGEDTRILDQKPNELLQATVIDNFGEEQVISDVQFNTRTNTFTVGGVPIDPENLSSKQRGDLIINAHTEGVDENDRDVYRAALENALESSEAVSDRIDAGNTQDNTFEDVVTFDEDGFAEQAVNQATFDNEAFENSSFSVAEAAGILVEQYETGDISYRELRSELREIGRQDRSDGRAEVRAAEAQYDLDIAAIEQMSEADIFGQDFVDNWAAIEEDEAQAIEDKKQNDAAREELAYVIQPGHFDNLTALQTEQIRSVVEASPGSVDTETYDKIIEQIKEAHIDNTTDDLQTQSLIRENEEAKDQAYMILYGAEDGLVETAQATLDGTDGADLALNQDKLDRLTNDVNVLALAEEARIQADKDAQVLAENADISEKIENDAVEALNEINTIDGADIRADEITEAVQEDLYEDLRYINDVNHANTEDRSDALAAGNQEVGLDPNQTIEERLEEAQTEEAKAAIIATVVSDNDISTPEEAAELAEKMDTRLESLTNFRNDSQSNQFLNNSIKQVQGSCRSGGAGSTGNTGGGAGGFSIQSVAAAVTGGVNGGSGGTACPLVGASKTEIVEAIVTTNASRATNNAVTETTNPEPEVHSSLEEFGVPSFTITNNDPLVITNATTLEAEAGTLQEAIIEEILEGEGTTDAAAQRAGYESRYDVTLGYGKHLPANLDKTIELGAISEETAAKIANLGLPNDLKNAKLTELSVGQVRGVQEVMIDSTYGELTDNRYTVGDKELPSAALGVFQVTGVTLQGLIDKDVISVDDTFNEATQDKIGLYLLGEKRGFNDFLEKGDFSDEAIDEAIEKIAYEWASVEDPSNLGSGKYGQGTHTDVAELKALFERSFQNYNAEGFEDVTLRPIENAYLDRVNERNKTN